MLVNLFLDEVQGYANDALLTLLQESRKYGARTAGATLSLSSIPEDLQKPFNNLFGNKIVFRTNDLLESEKWSKSFSQLYSSFIGLRDHDQDRIRVGADDIMSLQRYHAVCKISVNNKPLEAFIAKTIKDDPRARSDWVDAHSWPKEKKDIQIIPVKIPELQEANISGDKTGKLTQRNGQKSSHPEKEVFPSIHGVTSSKVKQIVKELGIEYNQAKSLLAAAAGEIENRKLKRGITTYLKEYLKKNHKTGIEKTDA